MKPKRNQQADREQIEGQKLKHEIEQLIQADANARADQDDNYAAEFVAESF